MTNGRFGYWLRQVVFARVVWRLRPVLYAIAFLWRRLLFRTTFIAITGSIGKTTAKECLADILASVAPTYRTYRNQNGPASVTLNILRVRPWHRFAVLELGIEKPNTMWRPARLVRPDLAVILRVARTHTRTFRDPEQYAAEKSVLLRALKPGGLALLNKDDPLVALMGDGVDGRVRYFGEAPECDYRAEMVSDGWPRRLTFVLRAGGASETVETQLVGRHWLHSCLAALAAADCLGVKLEKAARVLRNVQPFPGRLLPVRVPSGAIILRDDYSASVDTMEASFRVLEQASAERRLLVITDMSDSGTHRRHRMKYFAERSARAAEVAVFIGEETEYGKRRAIEAGMRPENVHAFSFLREAAEFLRLELRPGDLVLLKGRTTDHATRIFFAQLGDVGCWKTHCSMTMMCDICWELQITPEQLQRATIVLPEPLACRQT